MSNITTKTVKVVVAGDSTGAQKALKDAEGASSSAASKIKSHMSGIFTALNASGALAPFEDALQNIDGVFSSMAEHVNSLGDKVGNVGIGVAGAGAGLTALGSTAKQADAQLAAAFQDAGKNAGDYKDQIEKTVKENEQFGISSVQTKGSLQQLVQATGDPAKAFGLMGDAANLAAAKHESLETATTQLIQIMSGKGTRTLAQFGITQQQVAAAAKHHETALDLLSAKINGQASASVDSLGGKMKVLKTVVSDNVEELGAKYGPAISAVGVGITVTGKAAEGAAGLIGKLTKTTEAAAAGTDVLSGSTDALAVSEGAADTAALPLVATIGLVALAVAAVGIAIYELVTHWKTVWATIKAVVADAWHFIDSEFVRPIEEFFSSIVGFIKSHWELILAIITGPIGLAVLFIKNNFNDIVSFFAAVVGWIQGHWQLLLAILTGPIGLAALYIKNNFNDIVSFFAGIPQRILSAIGSLVNIGAKIVGDIASGVGGVVSKIWSAFTGIPGQIEGIFSGMFGLGVTIVGDIISGIGAAAGSLAGAIEGTLKGAVSHIPVIGGTLARLFADGGIVTRPTLGLIGEAGYPEAVVPLKNGLSADAIAASVNDFFGGGPEPRGGGSSGGGDSSTPAATPAATGSVGTVATGSVGHVVNNYFTNVPITNATEVANEVAWSLKTVG